MVNNSNEAELEKIPSFVSLDIFRGLAALWVVMTHACIPYLAGVGYPYRPYLDNPLYAISVYGQLGVVLFFVISGYCIAGAAYGSIRAGKLPRRFLFERIRRIYPPYFAACLLAIVVRSLIDFAANKHIVQVAHSKPLSSFQLGFWLANLSLTQAETGQDSLLVVFWTLSYEVAFYAIVFVFFQIGHRFAMSRNRCWAYVATLCNITTFASLILKLIPAGPFSLFPLDLWWQFGLGAIVFQIAVGRSRTESVRSSGVAKSIWVFLPCILAIALLAATSTEQGSLGHPSTRLQAIVCLTFGIVLAVLYGRDNAMLSRPIFKPFFFLGTFSYSLYLVHTLIQPFIDVGMRRIGFVESRYIVTYFVQIVASVVSGWLFFIVVERHFLGKAARVRLTTERVDLTVLAPAMSEERSSG